MKTFIKTACAILIIGAIFTGIAQAQSGAVYSLNVVGFQKVTVEPSALTMPGIPFDPASAELNDLIGDQLTAAKNEAGADNIYVWDAVAQEYKKYFLRSTIGDKWVSYTDPNVATTDAFLNVENGFWINASAVVTQELVLVGDVVNDAVVTNNIVAGLNMISYPFSTPMSINEIGLTGGTAAKNEAGADNIYVWDADSQQYIEFFFRSTVGNKWVAYTDPNTVASNVIDPAAGMWYNSIGSFTWEAVRPYTLD